MDEMTATAVLMFLLGLVGFFAFALIARAVRKLFGHRDG